MVVLVGLVLAGYIAFRVAAYNGVIIVTHGARRIAPGQLPLPTGDDNEFSIFVVGDTGKDSPRRSDVVNAMRRRRSASRVDAVFLAGDNFYEAGVTSMLDPRFQVDFEQLFGKDDFDMPFYVCLGNHDHYGNVDAQVQYSRLSSRWKMPNAYYRFSQSIGTETVDVFVIDTVPIAERHPSANEQLNWLREELANSDAHWKIVMGHHPAISGGRHDASVSIRETLSELFRQYGVDVYVSGHDHDLQLIDSHQGWLQLVSGAGSKLRSTSWIDQTIYAKSTPGYCWLAIRQEELYVSFFSPVEHLLTYTVRKPVTTQIRR
tara:strand:+ start:31111 stop:32064 length:954 start_codon:yes stop_codon:yes gene_type:complete